MVCVPLLLALVSSYAVADPNSECSNWYYRPPGSSQCKCGQTLSGGIMCSEGEVYLRVDYTMTHDDATNQTVVAINHYGYNNYSTIKDRVYTLLPSDSRELNEMVCLPNNRKGFLCEDCIEGFGPTAYSPKCTNCPKRSSVVRVTLFLILRLLPITVMFLLLVVFRINLTQGPIFGYVIYCQAHTLSLRNMTTFYPLLLHKLNGYRRILDVSLIFSSFWVMDYSPLYGSSCISQSFNNLDVMLLNFVSVFYPLVLMLLTYIFIELHARDVKLVVLMWKPFKKCFSKIRRNWSATDSIIHAYATLLLLSFSTLNYNAFHLLRATNVYNSTGSLYTGVLYNQPSIHLFSPKYMLYFGIVLVFMLFLGVIPTALLCIHSVKLFRKKLNNCCSHRIQIALNTFADTFHATFKDGLNGTRDYRVLPAVFALLTMFSVVIGTFGYVLHFYLIPFFVVMLAFASLLIAYALPCKSFMTNVSLSFHLLWMAAIAIISLNYVLDIGAINIALAELLVCFIPIPHVLMFLWVVYKVLRKIRCLETMRLFLLQPIVQLRAFGRRASRETLLPDRLENSHNYCELQRSAGHIK